ncbi:hypothetical protein RTE01_36010 [Raoultella terrigena]|nr:hypothetical protein RTE01_36010 [Raoultella terrigena]
MMVETPGAWRVCAAAVTTIVSSCFSDAFAAADLFVSSGVLSSAACTGDPAPQIAIGISAASE